LGKKEYLQKELDLILEKLRFWRYVIFGIFSGVIGVLFSVTQKKIIISVWLLALFVMGFLLILFSVKRISQLTREYYKFLEELERV
jgi:sulfite exporter TauE/SafE